MCCLLQRTPNHLEGDVVSEIISIDVTDEIAPFLERMAGHTNRSIQSAAKSLGWFLQREIKKGVKSGSPGGESFQARMPHALRAKLQGGSAARQWYGRMTRAIGYQYKDGVLRIGWTSKTSAMYGRKQEFGFRTKVTEAIRKKFAEAGIPLKKSKAYLDLPARNVFEPMSDELQPQIGPYMQERLNEYGHRNVEFAKKARRKYRVY